MFSSVSAALQQIQLQPAAAAAAISKHNYCIPDACLNLQFASLLLLCLLPLYWNRFGMNLLLQQLQMASHAVACGLFLHAVFQFAVAKPCPTPMQHIAHESIAPAAAMASPTITSGLCLHAVSQLAVAKLCATPLQQIRHEPTAAAAMPLYCN